jgi:hypothetical protein
MEYPTSGIVWSAPAVVGKSLDSVKPVTYARPFQLERLELSSPIVVELCRVDRPLLLKNLLDEVATVQVLDNQELPVLREAHAARVVDGRLLTRAPVLRRELDRAEIPGYRGAERSFYRDPVVVPPGCDPIRVPNMTPPSLLRDYFFGGGGTKVMKESTN